MATLARAVNPVTFVLMVSYSNDHFRSSFISPMPALITTRSIPPIFSMKLASIPIAVSASAASIS